MHARLSLVAGLLLGWFDASFSMAADNGPNQGGLELREGDHICIIGNTLAERMQHYGWLEARLHSRFAQHRLVVRNLGYSGDEIELAKRLRSRDFGTPDQWLAGSAPIPQPEKLVSKQHVRENRFELTGTRADVIFAFFGYNESFAGQAGLPKFKQDLDAFIKHTLAQKYNGKTAPRLVLFSPIAHEEADDPHRPDGGENNRRLELYTRAMAEVAESHGVLFVDLFHPTLELYRTSQRPLTINGVHMNEHGDELLAAVIEKALFPAGPQFKRDAAALERLRQAVIDKNFYWYHRYRTTDGYSTYGDRAFLKFTDGQSNYEVLQRELEVLDVMTANRDQRIWALAQGKDLKVDDSNTPPFIPVVSNKPGPLPGGKHVFLTGEGAIEKMTIGQGLKVNLFASEEMFPELVSPVQMAWDTKGRLWVAAWPTYPHWKPKEPMNDKLLILEDTNGDGRADVCKTFAGDLHNPTGFEFYNGGVLVAMAPDLLFLKDTDGDDKADVRQRVLHGLDTADTHHTANSFTLDPGGALYFQEGTFHHSQVETAYAPAARVANGAVFRYEPRSQKFDVYVSFGFANPHGHVFDRWGQDIVVDGTGAVPYHGTLFSGHINFPQKHSKPPQVYQQRTRPCPGMEILSSRHFPAEFQENLLVPNVIGFQGILRYKVEDQGSSFSATELEPILYSSDPNFRPADVETGPDGAIYFTDWHNPIIGHMQHNLRDPNRNKTYGRVYRVTHEGRPLSQPPKIAGEPIEKLLDLLKHPENRVRYRTRIELSGRESQEVLDGVERWMARLDKQDASYEHHLLEALWIHQHHNEVNLPLLERLLESLDFRARAAAVRVLCYWRDRVSPALDLLRRMAADEHPRVRLEAVRTASFFALPEAVEIPEIAAERPMDVYLDYLRGETMKTLDPIIKQALAEGREIAFTTDVGARYLVRNTSTEQLLKMERSRAVYLEMLYRPGLQDEQRREAVRGLARLDGKPELRVIMDAIHALDAREENANVGVVFDLVRQLTGQSAAELATARAELEKLALRARQPIFRQIGFVSLINVDGSVERAWKLATGSADALRDFVNAMPLISDASVRASLYPLVEPLLTGLPEPLAAKVGNSQGTIGRFVRIELGRRATLTLAEVEVYSDGRNVARLGRASQRTTAHGGDAQRAIDGNKSGAYGDGGQTHTEENKNSPWWEVDLGEELPIESIVIYNRTDGDLGQRLQGYTLSVLDKGRGEVFRRQDNPAPREKAEFELSGGGPAAVIRRAAMTALTHVRGQELRTFELLSRFVREDEDRAAAVHALLRLPRATWPKEEARPLVDVLLAEIRQTPPADRTMPAALAAQELAHALAALLPAGEAKQVRSELEELGVRVIRIGTLLERMSYDKEIIAVKAGKPVEFIFENTDLMPHNLVIIRPGSLEEIGLMSEAAAQQPEFARRHFVPQSKQVLLASTLLQPRQSEKLSFMAPTEPGVYPYVCTYPGHWRRMYGALYVVSDLDAYLESPESYLAAHPLEIKDALLKDRRPRTEWKLEDLAGAVEELHGGRSFGNARQMFQVANCVACHKLNGAGNQFGPDLAQLDAAKFKPLDILKEVLDPSAKINEKFQTWQFELESGKILTAMLIEETPEAVKVIENPLAKAEPLVLRPSEIAGRQKSPISMMPKGLLDKLSRDEILDLMAYVISRGNQKHPLFQGGHEHSHGQAPASHGHGH
jgi:putative heme-binding domain-containing protein